MPEHRETPAERAAWKEALAYHTVNPVQLNQASLEWVLLTAKEMDLRPVRLVVGPNDRLQVNLMFGQRPSVDGDQIIVPHVEGIRLIPEGCSHFVMEIVTGDFPDDGRWYVEDHAGRRAGSVGYP